MYFTLRSTQRVSIPNNNAPLIRRLLNRLLADDSDGDCFQAAIQSYFSSERPLVLILRGTTTCLYVEGPWYTVGNRRFPLGAQLQTEFGWFDLSPMQAAELVRMDNEVLDATAIRWLGQERQLSDGKPARRDRNRGIDDPIALRQMAAAASGTPLETGGRHG